MPGRHGDAGARDFRDAGGDGRSQLLLDILEYRGIEAVALGDDGKPLLGKDARAPLTVTEWLEGMKDKAPHWWPAGSGGGAGNGGGGGSSAPKSLAECKTDAERVSYLQRASAT